MHKFSDDCRKYHDDPSEVFEKVMKDGQPGYVCYYCNDWHPENTKCKRILQTTLYTENGKSGALCDAIVLPRKANCVDLYALNFVAYSCPCGEIHRSTKKCKQLYPVYLNLTPKEFPGEENTQPMEKVAGYITGTRVWFRLNTDSVQHQQHRPWDDGVYLCACGQMHVNAEECPEGHLLRVLNDEEFAAENRDVYLKVEQNS